MTAPCMPTSVFDWLPLCSGEEVSLIGDAWRIHELQIDCPLHAKSCV